MGDSKDQIQKNIEAYNVEAEKFRIEASWEAYIELTIANFGHVPDFIQRQIDEKIAEGTAFIPLEEE